MRLEGNYASNPEKVASKLGYVLTWSSPVDRIGGSVPHLVSSDYDKGAGFGGPESYASRNCRSGWARAGGGVFGLEKPATTRINEYSTALLSRVSLARRIHQGRPRLPGRETRDKTTDG